jgi:hypothetical protein
MPAALTGVYMNKFVFQTINIRGFVRSGLHWTSATPTACGAGCSITNWILQDVESDSAGHMSSLSASPIVYEHTGTLAYPWNSITWIGGSFEDTVLSPTGSIFQATAASSVNGQTLIGSVNGNFPKYYDANWFSYNLQFLQLDQNGFLISNPFSWQIDSVPTTASAIGNAVPGGSASADWIVSAFLTGTWAQRFRVLNSGGECFYNTSGVQQSCFDNGGDLLLRVAGQYTDSVEGTAPSGNAGSDRLYADSTAHRWKMNNNNAGADVVVGGATVDALSNKTMNIPLTSGTGLQIFNTTTTCTTAGSVGATCTTGAISLPVAEADTSYRVTCTGKGPTAVPVISTIANSSATQFTITIAALTAVAASFTSFDCIAGHN